MRMQRLLRLLDIATEYRHRAVLGALIIASVARLAYVTYLGDDIGGPDGPTYDRAGWDLATRGVMSPDVAGLPYWPPGYPLVVAGHYLVAGHHPYAVKLSQIVLIGLLTWLTFRLAERVGGPKTALFAGVGMSLSLVWLALSHPLMYEPWQAALLVVALLALLHAERSATLWPIVGAGVALGGAAAMQDKFLTLVPLLAIWLALSSEHHQRRRIAAPLLLLTGAALVVAPLVVRNKVVYGEPYVLANNHGINFVIGNGPDATGGYVGDASIPPSCSDALAKSAGIDRDRSLTSCSIRYAVAHPVHTISLWPGKLARFWAPFVGPRFEEVNWQHFFDWRRPLPDSVRSSGWFRTLDVGLSAIWALFGVGLLVLGAAVLLRANRRTAILLLIPIGWLMAVHVASFGDPRFRIPILPLVWICQSAGLIYLLERRAARRAAP